MTPTRIQRKRTKGWRMPPNTVYVGRPTKWGNPWPVIPIRDRAEAQRLFCTSYICGHLPFDHREIIDELRGKNLACWCPLDQPCHADVLLEIANS